MPENPLLQKKAAFLANLYKKWPGREKLNLPSSGREEPADGFSILEVSVKMPNGKSKPWLPYQEGLKKYGIDAITLRRIMPDEISADCDNVDTEELIKYLISLKIGFTHWTTTPNNPYDHSHLRFTIKGLAEQPPTIRKIIKEDIIRGLMDKLGRTPDLCCAYPCRMISIEYGKHHKRDEYLHLIKEYPGKPIELEAEQIETAKKIQKEVGEKVLDKGAGTIKVKWKCPVIEGIIENGREADGVHRSCLILGAWCNNKGMTRKDAIKFVQEWDKKNAKPEPADQLVNQVGLAYENGTTHITCNWLKRQGFCKVEDCEHEKNNKAAFIKTLKFPEEFEKKIENKTTTPKFTINTISDGELMKYKAPDNIWIVNRLIPESGIAFFAGKRSSCKTWAALHLALALASGTPLFGTFDCEKSNVLFLDEESGIDAIKERVDFIKQGMGLNDPLDGLDYASFEGIKLDRAGWMEALEAYLKKKKIKIIIVDSLRRIIAGEENDATTLNQIFTEIVRPITKKYGCAWCFIHHLRKGQPNVKAGDIMDELRGSSDFANYADSIITFKRVPKSENKFIFRHAKSRRAKEQPPYIIAMNWEENEGKPVSVSFENEGTAENVLDQIDLACRQILIWLEETGTASFKTLDAKNVILEQGFSSRTVERALKIMVGRGDLVKPKKGHFIRIGAPDKGLADKENPPIRQTRPDGSGGKGNIKNKPIDGVSDKPANVYIHSMVGGSQKEPAKPAFSIKYGGLADALLNLIKGHTQKSPILKSKLENLALDKKIIPKDNANLFWEILEKMKEEGVIFCPTPGEVKIV